MKSCTIATDEGYGIGCYVLRNGSHMKKVMPSSRSVLSKRAIIEWKIENDLDYLVLGSKLVLVCGYQHCIFGQNNSFCTEIKKK